MANSDKNIVITPNVGQAADPKIVFSGADSVLGPQNITLQVYPTSNGTLSFEGSAGQLFSITNSLSGSIFSVNDVSGIPSIEVLDTGTVKIAQYNGTVLLGTNSIISTSTAKLQIAGSGITGSLTLARTDTPTSGSSICGIDFYGYDSTTYVVGGTINFRAAENWTATNRGTDIQLRTTASGSGGALFEAMRINSAGNVGIGALTPLDKLHLREDVNSAIATQLLLHNAGAGSHAAGIAFATYPDAESTAYMPKAAIVFERIAPNGGGVLKFFNRATNDTNPFQAADEHMRIVGAGRVIIGTVTDNGTDKLQINGTIIGTQLKSSIATGTAPFVVTSTTRVANLNVATAGTADTATSADQIDGIGFRNTGSNAAINADTIESNGITYYSAGVSNFSGNATDGALFSQAYSAAWQLQIAGDYRSGQIATRGKNNGTWQAWRTQLDSSNFGSYALPLAGGTLTGLLVGRSSAGTDVNVANDTGSLSVRGSTTTVAAISFHRTGAYAINMGLGTDNIFRIGGWSASSNAFQMTGGGALTMLGDVTAFSDIRLKDNIKTIPDALTKILNIRGVTFTRTDQEDRERVHIGVIAQEIEKYFPEVVLEDTSGIKSVNYGAMAGAFIEAIKEQQAKIDQLESLLMQVINGKQ